MKKITKRQNDIFKAHMHAFKNNSFDIVMRERVSLERWDMNKLKEDLLSGKTNERMFVEIVSNKVSITSQLMMAPTILGIVSGKALKDIRDGFKEVLTNLGI